MGESSASREHDTCRSSRLISVGCRESRAVVEATVTCDYSSIMFILTYISRYLLQYLRPTERNATPFATSIAYMLHNTALFSWNYLRSLSFSGLFTFVISRQYYFITWLLVFDTTFSSDELQVGTNLWIYYESWLIRRF